MMTYRCIDGRSIHCDETSLHNRDKTKDVVFRETGLVEDHFQMKKALRGFESVFKFDSLAVVEHFMLPLFCC